MSTRLLRAAARGARIQKVMQDGEWIQSLSVPIYPSSLYRVHPEDSHLMYGKLATFFRECAAEPPISLYSKHNSHAYDAYCHFSNCGDYASLSGENRVTYLLLLAEFVEDEAFE